MDSNLLSYTSRHFDSVNFSELNERWLDDVIDSEFTDVEVDSMSIGILFADDATDTLRRICDVCNGWIKKTSDMDLEESNTGNVSTRPEEVLWTYLNEMDISVKQIHGIIYFLCCKSMKKSSTFEDKEIGLLSAKWYFCCLRVPGSSAYSVYNSNLFRLCIDCLQMPDLIDSQNAVYTWRDFEELLPSMVFAVESLVPMLSVCHLGNDTTTVDHVIRKLGELVGSELSSTSLNFDLDFLSMTEKERRRRYSSSFILTSLAYQGLASLMKSDLNGEKEYIYTVVLSALNRHILCMKTKKTPIPSKFLTIKDNAVSFICYNLKDKNELHSKLTSVSLRRLALSVCDRADFRSTVSQAIISILFYLQVQDIAEFVNWLLFLGDAHDMNNRVFALEVFGLLLENLSQVDSEGLPESMKVYLSPIPIIFSILTRCDDTSPGVRTKALSVVSHYMKLILNVLMDVPNSPTEEFDEDFEIPDENGDHRSFWYTFTSFKDMVEEISNILHRRIDDNNGTARKAALQALESIICFTHEYLSEDNLKLFVLAAKDPNIVMRKQMIQSLTTVLETYPDLFKVQECWLKCILPLVHDPENTVQAKVLSVIEEKFLQNILSDRSNESDAAFCLLEKLSRGELLSHQRYLQKAFSSWKADKKLRSQLVLKLGKHFGSGKHELVWFYLCIFGAFCKLPTSLCHIAVEEFQKQGNWENITLTEYLLKVLGSTFTDLAPEKLEIMRRILMDKLERFTAPVEILPLMIDILNRIERHLENNNDFAGFADRLMTASMETLTPFISRNRTRTLPTEELAIKSLSVVKEICQIYPSCITQNVTVVLKSFVFTRRDESDRGSTGSSKTSTCLRAHAYAALGKLSLQHEELGKELLPLLTKELLTSESDVIRNNAAIIMIDVIKCYTSLADKYLPFLSNCFKDPRYMVRYQSITLLMGLLQEEFIKWRGSLQFCLLSTVVDKNEAIQELGKYCMCNLLQDRRKTVFCEPVFVESIFVFNHFQPPDNESLANTVKELKRFALPYDRLREQRMQIYKFMLNHMDPSCRGILITDLCREILTSVAEAVFPLNEVTKSMVRDCLAVLASKEIRAFDSDSLSNEFEEGEEERAVKAELEIRKVMLVQPVIPVMISLKNCASYSKSDLLSDVVLFLKDILTDYKSEIPKILEGDSMLLKQVQFEMRNETMQLEKEAKKRSRELRNAKKAASPPSGTHIAEKAKEISAYLIQQGRQSLCPGEGSEAAAGSNDVSLRLIPQTPQNRNTSRAKANHNDSDSDINLPSSSNMANININEIMFASTPRVLLKPLKLSGPDISRIICRVDEMEVDEE